MLLHAGFVLLLSALEFFAHLQMVSAQVQFSEYIQAPSSRKIRPVAIISYSSGTVNAHNQQGPISDASTTFTGLSQATFDFGINIAGKVVFNIDTVVGTDQTLDFTFTESSIYISAKFCDATSETGGRDVPLEFKINGTGSYSASNEKLRGGFRYMTVSHNSNGMVSLSSLYIDYTAAAPLNSSPTAYLGHFNCDNDKLNRVWYAGAYTNQLCTIDPSQGSSQTQTAVDWFYNYTLSTGTSILADGAKRDRLLWPGDIAVAGPSLYVSTGDASPILNSLLQLFSEQNSIGQLPYVGEPIGFLFSYTYHLHTLIDVYDYFMYTGDLITLNTLWPRYVIALDYSVGTIDSTGLGFVSDQNDWLRSGMGGHNIEANAILYRAIAVSLKLSSYVNVKTDTSNWSQALNSIPSAAMNLLYDPASSLFKDNENSTVRPQDGNSYALLSGLVPNMHTTSNDTNTALAATISTSLKARWIAGIGAPAPEAGATISPFASGFELAAHFVAGHAIYALELIEFMWHDFMLLDPRMTNSTFIEGYSTDGSLRYAPYAEAARVSHAHGWSTAPTSLMTKYVAGIFLEGPAGKEWRIEPALGRLQRVEAGFRTNLGAFAVKWTDAGSNGILETPVGTIGSIVLRSVNGTGKATLVGAGSIQTITFDGQRAIFEGLAGGNYTITVR